MSRLIEIDDVAACASPLRVDGGDVLLLRATGARLLAGERVVEVLGPFTTALAAGGSGVIDAAGLPGTVLVVARLPGLASIAVFEGGSFPLPRAIELTIDVRA